jgi:RNA-directed DNA polymerase
LLSNIYLNPLDHQMAKAGYEMVRYADDFVILCRRPEEANRALALVRDWTATAGLARHPTKTRIVDPGEDAFEFLGYRFEAGKLPTSQESDEVQGHDPSEDEANDRRKPSGDH